MVLLAVPFGRYGSSPLKQLAGRVVVDAMNYGPERDGDIDGLDNGRTSSEVIAELPAQLQRRQGTQHAELRPPS